MQENTIKYELQHLISGKSGSSYDALVQTVANYLRSGKSAGPMAEEKLQNKPKETKRLLEFARQNGLLIADINQDNCILQGVEKRSWGITN